MLYGIVLLIHVFVSFVLIAVILLQAGRGGGLSDAFSGGAAQSILGTRGTTYLTRATTVCAAIFMLTSIGLAVLSVNQGQSLMAGRAAARHAAKPSPATAAKPAEPAPPSEQKANNVQQTPQAQTQQPKQETSGAH